MMESAMATIKAIRPLVHLMVMSFLFFCAFTAALPFMVDVTLQAICPGRTSCSQLILLMGGQQVITGATSVFISPVLGSFSDDYGRRPVFMVILFLAIVPAVVVAYSKSTVAIYLWFLFGVGVSVVRDGGMVPNMVAYVADLVDENQRASAMSVTMSAMSVGFLAGTMSSFIIKNAFQAYLVAAILQVSAAIYLVLFVKESNPRVLLPADQSENTTKLFPKSLWNNRTNKLRETAVFIWRSRRLRVISLVDFTAYLVLGAGGALQSFTLYFLKATFNFGKDQYAALTLTTSVCLVLGQILIYPTLALLFGEKGMLWIGLLCSFAHYIFYGLAWSPWVAYLAAAMVAFSSFISLSLGTMASRGVGPEQQGKVQGVLSGLKSTAGIISPFLLTPLTAAALGDNPPFHTRGLPFFIAGGVIIVAIIISCTVPSHVTQEEKATSDDYIQAPTRPEDTLNC